MSDVHSRYLFRVIGSSGSRLETPAGISIDAAGCRLLGRHGEIKLIVTSVAVMLILASQRIESVLGDLFGMASVEESIASDVTTKRGALPSIIEWFILSWVAGGFRVCFLITVFLLRV